MNTQEAIQELSDLLADDEIYITVNKSIALTHAIEHMKRGQLPKVDDRVRERIGIAVGEASMCWSLPPHGVFHSERATQIVDELCEYLKHLEEPPQNTRDQWQPIETYDYDGFPLVMLAGFITPSEYAQSNGSKPFWEISIGRCWHANTRKFTGFLGQQPTHWMPLPEPPQERKD